MIINFVTLSLGANYTKDYTIKLIRDVLTKTPHSIFITTDCKQIIVDEYPDESRIIINEINRDDLVLRINTDFGSGYATDFNFNMRYLSLEPVKYLEDHIVIFTDCDNSLDWWDENEIQTWLNNKIKENYDFFAPRANYLFKSFLDDYNQQKELKYGLFWHKIINYGLDKNPKPEWNNAPLPAEYLLIFYNQKNKLVEFCTQWKWFHDYLVSQNKSYGTWAEGFEIGVSSLVAGFNSYDIGWSHEIWKKAINPNGYKLGHSTEK